MEPIPKTDTTTSSKKENIIQTKSDTKITSNTLQNKVTQMFFNKDIMNLILKFLDETNQENLKKCFKNKGFKEKKKKIKEIIKNHICDIGEHNNKYKFKIVDNKSLVITTSIFNVERNLLKTFTYLYHKETDDKFQIEKEDLYAYLKVLPSMTFTLSNTSNDYLRISKGIIPFELNDEETVDLFDENKYEMFYNQSDLSKIDFSNKDSVIERQRKIMEAMNTKKETIFYPLEFISGITYWSIILCHGGYFAAGFFHKDTVIEHKSDHKYVTRKKAGQRQINKDKSKSIGNSGNIYNLT